MRQIDQITWSASRLLRRLRSLVAVGLFAGTVLAASAAAQPPFIGAFSDTGYSASRHYCIATTNEFQAKVWQIQLGSPSIICDKVFFQVIQNGSNLFESTTSYGPTTSDSWFLYDSGTGGSTREMWVKVAYGVGQSFHNSYYLTYQDSPYSRCYEEDGYAGIYNP